MEVCRNAKRPIFETLLRYAEAKSHLKIIEMAMTNF